jgi:hypothetical protein
MDVKAMQVLQKLPRPAPNEKPYDATPSRALRADSKESSI